MTNENAENCVFYSNDSTPTENFSTELLDVITAALEDPDNHLDSIVKEALSTAKLVLNEIARISKDAQGLRADMLQKVHQLTESIEAFEVPRIPVVSYINDKDKEQDEPVDIQI